MSKVKLKTLNMTEGNPLTTILIFAIPMILSNLFQQFYSLIDGIIVGKLLGTDAFAAVASAGSITAVFVQLASGLALGGSIVIAQYFGAGKTEKIWQCTTTSTIFSAAVALVSTIVIWFTAEQLLLLVNTPEELLSMSVTYLRCYIVGCIPLFAYNALNGVYTALGDSKTPLRFLIISSVLNVALDLILLMGFKMGIAAAALDTAFAQAVAMVLAFVDIPKLLAEFKHDKNEPVFDGKLLGTMLKFAVPSALQQSIVTVGSVVVQATINGFGAAVIAGSAAAGRVVDLATAIPVNYGFALSSYVGQNIGANKLERIRPGLLGSIFTCGAISLVMTAIFELFPNEIVSLFVPKTEAALTDVLAVGSVYLRVVGAFLIVFTIFMLVKAVFKGGGDMGWFIFVTLLSFFIRLVLTVGFAHVFDVDIIWWAFCAGWIVATLVSIARYPQGGWRKKSII